MTGADGPVFLIGFMGSGKSKVGRALAVSLGWSFSDTDSVVEQTAGKPIVEIFRDDGEASFRHLESSALRTAGRPRTVVATGGGAFLARDNRSWMQHVGCVAWLDVSLAEARRRLGAGPGRPLWDPTDRVEQRALYERRRATYALAGLRIAVDGTSPEALAERIRSEIR